MKSVVLGGVLVLAAQAPQGDTAATEEVRALYEAFNEAWEARDMEFVRDYFAHDPDMLLFFERRQLTGWRDVETLYENMFAHARPGSVTSGVSNLRVKAKGDMAYVAANFHLTVTNPEGEEMADTGRASVVFERREGKWKVVHRHTSFQAPAGPQRAVPLHTDPGPLWSPQLEGAWRGENGALLVATTSYLVADRVPGLPPSGRYRIEGRKLTVTSEDGLSRDVDVVSLSTSQMELKLPSGTAKLRRLE
jgi:uncharacterized protein (TIGR02246 family)